MTERPEAETGKMTLSRRSAVGAVGVCFAMLSEKALASTASVATPATTATYTRDAEANGMVEITGIHKGKGKGKAKFFRFGGSSAPAHFMVYDLPPGASEGLHVHFLDDRNKEGSFDEYYYIISGEGVMDIDGEAVAVTKGDHVHTPLEVAHGIENTHPTENLRVFLTFIKRGNEPGPTVKRATGTMGSPR